jgi:hypothetical protein
MLTPPRPGWGAATKEATIHSSSLVAGWKPASTSARPWHHLVAAVELERRVDPDAVAGAQGQDGATPAPLLDRLAGHAPSTRAIPVVL